jgi:hypothetical protein
MCRPERRRRTAGRGSSPTSHHWRHHCRHRKRRQTHRRPRASRRRRLPPSGAADVEVEPLWQGIATAGTRVAIAVDLDGEPIVDGPMRQGFRAAERWPVGPHTLTVTCNDEGKGFVRMRHYRIEVIVGHEYTIVLRWSRLLQNFTQDLAITSR